MSKNKTGLKGKVGDKNHWASGKTKETLPPGTRLDVRLLEARSLLASDVETGANETQ